MRRCAACAIAAHIVGAAVASSDRAGAAPGMEWLDDTEWTWNSWSNVQLVKGGTFVAENCVDPEQCTWHSSGEHVVIRWADAGSHTMRPSAMAASADTLLRGTRDADGDPCSATFVRKGYRLLGVRLPAAVEKLAPHFFAPEHLHLVLALGALAVLLALGCACLGGSAHADAALIRSLGPERLRRLAAELHPAELEKLIATLEQVQSERAASSGGKSSRSRSRSPSPSPTPEAAPVDAQRLACAASVLLPGAVFYLSTAPNVCLVDAGALTLAAAGPGVAHPAGFPLWTMLGWVSTQFPGSEIRNTNLLSAVCATLLCHLLWRLSRRWMLRSLSPASATGSAAVPVPPLLELGPLCGAMLAGLGFPVWGFATFAEVYHVTSSGLVAAILVTCHWRDRNPGGTADDSLIAAGGLLFGMGACAHHITAALALPALIFLAATRPSAATGMAWAGPALKHVGIAAAAAVVPGVVTYGWLYYVGSSHPLWNWVRSQTILAARRVSA